MSEEVKVRRGSLDDLTPDDRNMNKHTSYGMSLIEKSIRKHKFGRSILVDKNDRIIGGNGVTETAASIGATKTIVVETTGDELVVVKRTDVDLDSKEGREMALADNATAVADIEWDAEAVKEIEGEFEINPEDWGVVLDELEEEANASEDDFNEETDNTPQLVKAGELWKLGDNYLLCGDSTKADDIQRLLGGGKADMIFTDPPYGVKYAEKNEFLNGIGKPNSVSNPIENDSKDPASLMAFLCNVFGLIYQFTKERMIYYITAPQGGNILQVMQALEDSGFAIKQNLVWNKNNHVLGRSDYNYKHEPIIYGWKKDGTHKFYGNGNFHTSVWDIAKPLKSDLHPTMKPVELVTNALLDGSKSGDIVLDVFGGSGTTLIACEQLGRKCYMMELDPHYCDVIIARWEKLTGKKAEMVA